MVKVVYILIRSILYKSDSIGNDALTQAALLRENGYQVKVVSEAINPNFSDEPITPIKKYRHLVRPDDISIYHYCDAWDAGEHAWLESESIRFLRYHNNTPWQFFAPYSKVTAKETLSGAIRISELIKTGNITGFLANSKFTVKQLIALGAKLDQCAVVYPFPLRGKAHGKIEPDQKILNDLEDSRVILFVGRFVPHKGHRHFLNVIKRVRDQGLRDVRGILVGRLNGYMMAYNKEMEILRHQLGLEDAVEFIPEVSDSVLTAYYQSAAALLYLSEHEGFGLPVVESLFQGIPVIAGRNSALYEEFSSAVSTFRVNDYDKITEELIRVLQDNKFRTAVCDRQKSLVHLYSYESIRSQFLDVLNSFLEKGFAAHFVEEETVPIWDLNAISAVEEITQVLALLSSSEFDASSSDLEDLEIYSLNRRYGKIINRVRKMFLKLMLPFLIKEYKWSRELKGDLLIAKKEELIEIEKMRNEIREIKLLLEHSQSDD